MLATDIQRTNNTVLLQNIQRTFDKNIQRTFDKNIQRTFDKNIQRTFDKNIQRMFGKHTQRTIHTMFENNNQRTNILIFEMF